MEIKYRRIWNGFFVFIILCWMGGALCAQAQEKTTVRVGFYREEGYHTVDAYGQHGGYDYEYLTEIAKYTGWDYEFVEGSWAECITALESGEIDLLGGVEQRRGRQDWMYFAQMPSMYETGCLLIASGSDRFAYEEFAAFDGMKVGTIGGSALATGLERYSKENGFSYTLEWYDTQEELDAALRQQEIDCIYLSDNRNLQEYKLVARFEYNPLYYAVSRQKKELVDALDEALRQIHTKNHYFENDLFYKYYADPAEIAFTTEEEAYIRQNGPVQVALQDGFPLICEYDAGQKRYTGIMPDVLERMSEKIGLEFSYIRMPEDTLPWEYAKGHPNVILAPFFNNSLISYNEQILMLETIVQGRMTAVSRQGSPIALNQKFRLAIPADMLGTKEKIGRMFPKAEIISCSSHQDGLFMVRDGKADMTLVNEISGSYLLQSPFFQQLQPLNIENIYEDLTLALGKEADPLLVSVLNKGITSFSERDIRQIMVDNTTAGAYQPSPREWAYQNRYLLLLATVLAAGSLALVWVGQKRRKKEKEEIQKIRLAEERHKADVEYQQKMFRQANFDGLTGLYNKNYFIVKATALLKENPDTVYSFFRINVEKFKMINEIYGQEKGDIVLCRIADQLRSSIGKDGVYARVYSDHFVACYPIDKAGLEKSRKPEAAYLACAGQNIRVQADVGVYINAGHATDVVQLLDYAQIALQSKGKAGNDHFLYYHDSYMESLLRNQKITNEMEQALLEGQFHVFLQPQYDHMKGRLVGAEALIRWFHPTEGIVSPGDFIPVFEGNRFIYRLDAYVCEEVCRLLAKWIRQGKAVPVSINISRVDLQNPELLPMLLQMLDKYDIPQEYLHLEITESAYVENQSEVLGVIEQLQRAGFLIEMDDFGSGYSSLNMLKDIPVDVLKLDMKFLSGENNRDRGGSIVEAVVKLSHRLQVPVIAEGVETQREADFLKSVQCHLVQGYLYSRPLAVDVFEALLAESRIGEKGVPL